MYPSAWYLSQNDDFSFSYYLGLPPDGNIEEFQSVCKNTEGYDPEPMTRIAALLANEEQVGLEVEIFTTVACESQNHSEQVSYVIQSIE